MGPGACEGPAWAPKADLWSLGIILLELVQGRLWHEEGTGVGEIIKVCKHDRNHDKREALALTVPTLLRRN